MVVEILLLEVQRLGEAAEVWIERIAAGADCFEKSVADPVLASAVKLHFRFAQDTVVLLLGQAGIDFKATIMPIDYVPESFHYARLIASERRLTGANDERAILVD